MHVAPAAGEAQNGAMLMGSNAPHPDESHRQRVWALVLLGVTAGLLLVIVAAVQRFA